MSDDDLFHPLDYNEAIARGDIDDPNAVVESPPPAGDETGETGETGGDDPPPPPAKSGPSQASQLLAIAQDAYWFGVSIEGTPFAVPKDGPNVVRMLRDGRLGLRAALAAQYNAAHPGKVASASALADTMATIEGRCQDEHPTALSHRVARHDDGIVYDLGNPDGRVVVIEPGTEWKVLDRSPLRLLRSNLTKGSPEPSRAGGRLLAEPLGNITAGSWPMVLGWLVAALIPDIPHPVLLLRGEQGTGKSTIAAAIGALVDPSAAPLRSTPRDVEAWTIAAAGSHVVVLDNIGPIQQWLSDALCRAVTGDGLVRRKLYTDSDVTVLSFRRAVILTAIDAGALSGDLADRLLPVDLEPIDKSNRRTDDDVRRRFDDDRPALLAELFDLLADVLAVLPTVELAELPRMADFARVLAAVGEVRGLDPSPLDQYLDLAVDLARDVIDGDPFALAVMELARAQGCWRGTATELLAKVVVPDPRPKHWPRTPEATGGALRRVTPALRAVGVDIERSQSAGAGSKKIITLRADAEDPT